MNGWQHNGHLADTLGSKEINHEIEGSFLCEAVFNATRFL